MLTTRMVGIKEFTKADTPVAVIALEPSELAGRRGLRFRSAYDDLDTLAFAVLTLPDGEEVALVRHRNASRPGTELLVAHDAQAVRSLVLTTLQWLDLSQGDVSWMRDDVPASQGYRTS